MRTVRFKQVDVFTARPSLGSFSSPFLGNPVAVILDAEGMTADTYVVQIELAFKFLEIASLEFIEDIANILRAINKFIDIKNIRMIVLKQIL